MTNQEIIKNHIELERSKIAIANSKIKDLNNNLKYWDWVKSEQSHIPYGYEEDEGVRGGLVSKL